MRTTAHVIAALLLCASACETAEERGARENAELDKQVKGREAEQDRKRAKVAAAAQEAEAATKKLAKLQAEQDQREAQARYSSLTAAGRVEALRHACTDGCNGATVKAIVDAAPEAERAQLRGMVPALEAAAGAPRSVSGLPTARTWISLTIGAEDPRKHGTIGSKGCSSNNARAGPPQAQAVYSGVRGHLRHGG
jgi:hypothetical protein